MCEFKKVDNLMLKVVTGVVTAVLVATIFFGVSVYGTLAAGVVSPEEHGVLEATQMQTIKDEFVSKEVNDRDREYFDRRLDRIESKLDQLLQER